VQLALVTLYTAPYCSVSLSHPLEFVNRRATMSSRGQQAGLHTVHDLELPAAATSVQCPPSPLPYSVCV